MTTPFSFAFSGFPIITRRPTPRPHAQEAEAAGIGAHVGATREAILLPLVVDSVLGLVDSMEKLTAIVVVPAEPGMPSPKREWAVRAGLVDTTGLGRGLER